MTLANLLKAIEDDKVNKFNPDILAFLETLDVSSEDDAMFDLLFKAAQYGCLVVIEKFIKAGVDCNPRNTYGSTPLHLAALGGHLVVMQAIWGTLPVGVYCNPRNDCGNTPLHIAASAGKLDVVEAIFAQMSKVANYNPADNGGVTPLHCAITVSGGYRKVALTILAKIGPWADCNPKDKTGDTPLHKAARFGDVQMVRAILARLSPNACNPQNKWDYTPLREAANHGYLGVMQEIWKYLPAGADCNPRDKSGNTPLHEALAHVLHNNFYAQYLDIAKAIVARGVDVTVKNNHTNTPIYIAAFSRRPEAINLFLDLEDIEVNNVGEHSLLAFFHHESETAARLRAKGCLEMRTVQNPYPFFILGTQWTHMPQVPLSIQESVGKLMQRISHAQAEAAYVDFRAYCQDDNPAWVADLTAIRVNRAFSKPLLVKALANEHSLAERVYFFQQVMRVQLEQMGSESVSQYHRDTFRLYCGLLWYALNSPEEQNKFHALKDQQGSADYAQKLQKVRNYLFEALIESRYAADSVFDAYGSHHLVNTLAQCNSACPKGICEAVIDTFSCEHEEIRVQGDRVSLDYDHTAPLKERMIAKMYELVMQAYNLNPDVMEKLLNRMTGAVGSTPLTPQTIQNFIQQGMAANDTILVGKFLGLMKRTVIEHPDLYGGLQNNTEDAVQEAYIAVEDAIIEITDLNVFAAALLEAYLNTLREKVRIAATAPDEQSLVYALVNLSLEEKTEMHVVFENHKWEEEGWFQGLTAQAQAHLYRALSSKEVTTPTLSAPARPVLSSASFSFTEGMIRGPQAKKQKTEHAVVGKDGSPANKPK